MATIEDAVKRRQRALANSVRVNAVLLSGQGGLPGVRGFEYGDSYEQPVPFANIDLTSAPSWMRAGQEVLIDSGIDEFSPRAFTGFLVAMPGEDPEYLRDRVTVKGAAITIGTPPDTAQSQINAVATLTGADIRPPLPSGTHIDAELENHLVWDSARASAIALRKISNWGRVPAQPQGALNTQRIVCASTLYNAFRTFQLSARSVGGLTDLVAMGQILDYVGVINRSFVTPPDGWYTLASDAALERARSADMLQKLMELGGVEFHVTPGDIVVIKYVDFFPAPTANFTYSTDTQASAYIVATSGELAITYNPTIRKGMTGQFTIPHLNVDGRYFVYGVRHVINQKEARTYLKLMGGNRLGGTVAVNPIASFTFKVARQVFSDRVYVIITAISESYAPDGSAITLAWADQFSGGGAATTTPDIATFTGKVATIRLDPSTIPAGQTYQIALTATATATGLTHSVTLDIPTNATVSTVVIAPLAVAATTRTMVTPDGGQNWNDSAKSTGSCVAARPPDGVNFGQYIFGFTDGRLERTLDSNASGSTQVLAAVGSAFNYAVWDWRDPSVVWAATTDAKIYRSSDSGATFSLYVALRTQLGLAGAIAGRRCLGLPAAGGVYFFGGDGVGHPLIAYDPVGAPLSGAWVTVTLTGDIATDTATPADATMRIVDYTAPGNGTEVMVLEWVSGGGGSLVALYSTTSAPGPFRAFTRATGLTAGLKTGRYVVGDDPLAPLIFHAAFADRDTWHSNDGIAWTQTVNAREAGFTPNDCIFESDVLTGIKGMQGTYLEASEDAGGTGKIYKSTDGLVTLGAFRPAAGVSTWPAGTPKPKMLASGAPILTSMPASDRLTAMGTDASPRQNSVFVPPTWSARLAVSAGVTANHPRIFALTATNWFATNSDDTNNSTTWGAGSYTKDAGATWLAGTIPSGGLIFVARDTGGRIWAISQLTTGSAIQTKVYYSDDNGDTWTLSTTLGTGAGANIVEGRQIFCHPSDANKIAIRTLATGLTGQITYTTNRGTSWTTNANSALTQALATQSYSAAIMLPNGRIIIMGGDSGAPTRWRVFITDDWGVTLATVFDHSITTAGLHGLFRNAGGDRVAFIWTPDTAGQSGVHTLYLSMDSGASFAAVTLAQTLLAFAGTTGQLASFTMSPTNDAIYLATNTALAKKIVKLSPVTAAGVWSDLTLNYPIVAWGNANLAAVPA